MPPADTLPHGEAEALLARLASARGWPAHASNGWTLDAIGGPFLPDAPTWIRVMCEPEHLAKGETVETQVERFAAWLAGLGWALRRESMTHPACFRLVPGAVAVEGPALAEARAALAIAQRTLLEETSELAADIRDQVGGWTLPPGQSAVVLAPGGHLSIVHTSALEQWAGYVERLLAALTGSPRATLPTMATLPTLERLGYAYYLRRRAPDAPTWDRLTAAQRDAELSAVRWVCDTALGAPGDGTIYAASPGSPPPTEPTP